MWAWSRGRWRAGCQSGSHTWAGHLSCHLDSKAPTKPACPWAAACWSRLKWRPKPSAPPRASGRPPASPGRGDLQLPARPGTPFRISVVSNLWSAVINRWTSLQQKSAKLQHCFFYSSSPCNKIISLLTTIFKKNIFKRCFHMYCSAKYLLENHTNEILFGKPFHFFCTLYYTCFHF